jgi:polyhydroxyalkanoate synthase
MTTPRGKAPLTKNTSNGRRPAARPSAAVPPPTGEPGQGGDLAENTAQLAAAAKAVPEPAPSAPSAPSAPFGGFGLRLATDALRFLGQQAVRQPQALLRSVPQTGAELLRIGLGKSQVAPQKGDKRFADPAWRENLLFRATMQAYLSLGSAGDSYVDELGIEGMNGERVRFALMLLRESLAPTNFFMGNPAAIKRALDTGGGSVRKGIANWAGDVQHNHGMPTMVDRGPFKLGENIAATPGAVIFRNEVFELIQYTPQSDVTYQRPMLVVPPQVNKYYALDLAPGRSMIEYLLKQGIGVFAMSWRNPTGEQRDWTFDTYVQATIDAVDVAREVSGSPDVNTMGACLGGMTLALAQAHLAASGDHRIHSVTMTVTLLDTDSDGRMFLFATPQSLALAKKVSQRSGVIDGWKTANMFAWLRPNDLVWNYWTNNYLLGQDPPAFDILAWFRFPSPAARPGGRQPDGARGRHDDPRHADRHLTHQLRYLRGGGDDRPHHAVAHLLPVHPDGVRSFSVRLVLKRPHPDRGGRSETPRARVLRQSGDAARCRAVAGGRSAARGLLVGALGGLAGGPLRCAGRATSVRRQPPLPGERASSGHLRTSMTARQTQ